MGGIVIPRHIQIYINSLRDCFSFALSVHHNVFMIYENLFVIDLLEHDSQNNENEISHRKPISDKNDRAEILITATQKCNYDLAY